MADIIQLLPDHVANQIAAGEVVQRPASVVKELIENAVDAGSTSIKLIIKDAGKTLVQVVDNGKGMSETDARLSFERHATSKIKAAEDLFQLHTKGFRGEALASIAAIAHVEMNTRQADEEVGVQIKIEGSTVVGQDVTVIPQGTSISVKNLFFNIPARRNFLKSDTVELRHIIDEFHRVALAHPDIHFEFYNNGSELFNLPVSNLRQRIVHIFGGKTNEKLVPVEEETEVVNLKGFICKPEFAKKTRGEQFFFVNNRFIKNSYLHHAVCAAFEGLIKEQTHPSYFLFLEVDPSGIDINIHPTKTEVKFDDEHAMYAILRSAVKHSLGQFNVAPVLDFERDSNLDTPYGYKSKNVNFPTVEVDADFNPFEKENKGKVSVSYPKQERLNNSWESLYVGLEKKSDFSSIEFESEEVTGSLFNEKEDEVSTATYQLHKKYIVTTIKSGMVIISQHRAHQRVLYEQYLKNITVDKGVSQQLLFPLKLNFSHTEIELLKELKDSLENTGFIFSNFKDDEVAVNGIPLNISESEVAMVVDQLLSDFQSEIPESSFSQADILAKAMCKTLAVKSGEILNAASQEALVNNLFATKDPTVSPFNKPTYITMSVEEIDKKFL
ncbi:DNA mismatch repair endonuclease MutL [Galbibacter pacificus]|uniref:DNA mismatch repair protein MutL n=1 Tax=Galbibacter pacificus TaxID=2996052 RepID=A0ABT6FNI0_9FLAO|nr:DNA mismatch repair endonuclease MutL [Galbibacter pacificus]MDG3581346.1 DNA mismatch repair endonuclease MutL [Galbibacter pacificus]MDG3584824.1 DNA mismatch repair endonuclease MutL [Galbibacter pacificus]